MDKPVLKLATIVSAPFDENTFVAHLEGRTDCLVFDPGLEPEKIFGYLDQQQLTPAALMLTHGHADHIGGNEALKERWPQAPIVIGVLDAPKLIDPWLNLSGQFGLPITSPPADVLVREGDVYSAAGFDLEVLDIPGHSVGHVVFVWQAISPIIVFGGDVLFAGGIGRTDFPDGSHAGLVSGIRTKLFTMPDDTVVLPGHGHGTTIGKERRTNPFVREK